MARPLRHDPPDLDPASALRARVQTVLAGRFERRATVLVAGAGFGKTTAIVRAFEENRLRSRGVDRWLACEPADGDPVHLAEGLSIALGLPRVVAPCDLVREAVEAVGAGSPEQVCLVVDDVHHLAAGSESAALLDDLLTRLPANAHVLLAGRARPALPLTRRILTGECIVLNENDLRLRHDDLASMSDTTNPEMIETLAGWPALVRLALQHDHLEDFVVEEVLAMIDAEQRAMLDVLVAIGEGDATLIEAIAGVSDASRLDEVPLVERNDDRFTAHELWADLLADDGLRRSIRSSAATELIRRGDHFSAVDVCLLDEIETHPGVLDLALRDALIVGGGNGDGLGSARLRRWAEAMSTTRDASPARQFLSGLAVRLDNPGSDDCRRLLDAAAAGFGAQGDTAGAVAALGALTYALHVRRDVAGLIDVFGKLGELADQGEASALPYPQLANALVATSLHDPAKVLEHTERLLELPLNRELRGVTLWLHANALTNLGRRAVEPADECHRLALQLPGIALIHFGARWRAGMIEDLSNNPVEALDGERDSFLSAAWETVFRAGVGDLDQARDNLRIVEASAGDQSQWQTAASVALPRAAVAFADGDVDRAAGLLRETIERHPLDSPARWYYAVSLPLLYPLLPEVRSHFDEQEGMGPLYQRDLVLNQAVAAVVDDGDLGTAGSVSFPERVGEFIPALGIRNAALLLAAAVAVERSGVDRVIVEFVELLGEAARREFRMLTRNPREQLAKAAKAILESTPVAPEQVAELSLLGGTDLTIGGVTIDSADWRRERVRALLTFLVLNPDTTRENVMAALWPDADGSSARRNLRSTLNVLHSVLEPERSGGDAPFFVRSTGQRLRLLPGERLIVDVDRFEQHVAAAMEYEDEGVSSLALEPYGEAVRLYRGDLLPDGYEDWVVFARDRLRAKYVAAAVRYSELLTATDRATDAIDVCAAVLSIEPWSEPAHRALIAAHLSRNDVAAARRAMVTCESALADLGGPGEEATAVLARRLTTHA